MDQEKALDAVGALMRERQKYEGWLEALLERRESSPPRVFERVHADYVARLESVMRQLGEHAPALAAQADALDGRLAALGTQEGDLRDQRAEAELRSMVGELTPDDWNALAKESDDALESIAEEQARLRDELSQVRELLSAATTPARALTPVEAVEATPEPVPPVPPAPMVDERAAESTPVADDVGEAPPPAAQDASATEEAVAAAETNGADRAPAEGGSPFDELKFLESVAEAPAESAAAPAAAPAAAARAGLPLNPSLGIHVQDGTPPSAVAGLHPSGATPMSANVTGAQPIVLRNDAAPTKTLKCTDCGAMNYPTEWYCERCGAELASL